MINFSYQRNGGIRFLKVGRIFLSFGLSKAYRPIGAPKPAKACRYLMITGPSRCSLATLAGMAD